MTRKCNLYLLRFHLPLLDLVRPTRRAPQPRATNEVTYTTIGKSRGLRLKTQLSSAPACSPILILKSLNSTSDEVRTRWEIIQTLKTEQKFHIMSSEPLLNDGYRSQPILYEYGSVATTTTDFPTSDEPNGDTPDDTHHHAYEKFGSIRTFFITCSLAGISLANTAVTGMLIVGIPEIARKLAIPDYLLLW